MNNESYRTIHVGKGEHDILYKALKQYLVYLYEKKTEAKDFITELHDYLLCSIMVEEFEEAMKEKKDAD